MDLVNGTGDPAVADAAAGRLTTGGVAVATVTSSTDAAASVIEFPAGAEEQARLLAEALGAADLLQPADVAQVTVVLGPADAAPLVEALGGFAGLTCASDG